MVTSEADLRLPLVADSKPPPDSPLPPPSSTSPALHGGGGGSLWGAVCNISTSIIGAGIMSIPAAFRVLGVLPALGLIAIVAVLCFVSVEFLLRYTHAGPVGARVSYADVMERSFPRWGSYTLQLCIVLTNIGALVMYLIIIGDVLSGSISDEGSFHTGVLQEWFGGARWWNGRPVALLVIVLALFYLTFRRRVDALSVSSLISTVLALAFVAITGYMAAHACITGTAKPMRPYARVTDLHSALELVKAIPVIVLAFTFHFNLHPIHNEMDDPSATPKAVFISLAICSAVYGLVGWSGYALFGDATMADVLANFDKSSGISPVLNDLIRICYAAHLVLVYPVIFFSLRVNTDGLLFPMARPIAFHQPRFVAVTVALAMSTYIAAIAIPNIWFLFQLFGSTTAVCLSLGFPAALVIWGVPGLSGIKAKAFAGLMIVMAVVTFVVVVASFFSWL